MFANTLTFFLSAVLDNLIGLRLDAFFGLKFDLVYCPSLIRRQWWTGRMRVENFTIGDDRPPLLLISRERLLQFRRCFEH